MITVNSHPAVLTAMKEMEIIITIIAELVETGMIALAAGRIMMQGSRIIIMVATAGLIAAIHQPERIMVSSAVMTKEGKGEPLSKEIMKCANNPVTIITIMTGGLKDVMNLKGTGITQLLNLTVTGGR